MVIVERFFRLLMAGAEVTLASSSAKGPPACAGPGGGAGELLVLEGFLSSGFAFAAAAFSAVSSCRLARTAARARYNVTRLLLESARRKDESRLSSDGSDERIAS